MRKKITTIGVAGMLLLVGILAVPLFSAKTITTEEDSLVVSDNSELQQTYKNLVAKLANMQFPSYEIRELYLNAYDQNNEGIGDDATDMFGQALVMHLDELFKTPPQGEPETTKMIAMKEINKIRERHEVENQGLYNSYSNAFDDIIRASICFEDFEEGEERDWAIEQFDYVMNVFESEEKSYLQPLIDTICNSKYLALDTNLTILILAVLFLITVTGFTVLPLGGTLVGVIEGAVIGAGLSIILSESKISQQIANEIAKMFPQFGDIVYEAAVLFIGGFVGFSAYFILFEMLRVVKVIGGIAFAIAGVVAIYVLVNEFWPEARGRDVSNPTTMPMVRMFFTRLFQRFPQFKLLGLFS